MRGPVHQAVVDYINSEPAKKLKERAAELLFKLGNSGMFQNMGGGVVGHLIKIDNPEFSPEMVSAAMGALGIPENFVPPSAILRDALPMMVHLKRLFLSLTGGRVEDREKLVNGLGKLAREFDTPDQAVRVSLEWLRSHEGIWLDSLRG